MSIKWNSSNERYENIRIYYVTAKKYITSHPVGADEMRLLSLSHKLAFQNFAAVFSSTTPPFLNPSGKSCIIIFDFKFQFSEELIPFWANCTKMEFNIDSDFLRQSLDLIQKALNIQAYYSLLEFNPIYFHNFLVFNKPLIDPVLYKIYPLLTKDCLIIRKTYEYQKNLVIGFKNRLNVDKFILIPPFNDIWKVKSVSGEEITVFNPQNKEKTLNIKETQFIIISKPSMMLQNTFSHASIPVSKSNYMLPPVDVPSINIKPFEERRVTDDSIVDFFNKKFNKKEEEEVDVEEKIEEDEYYIEEPPTLFKNIITEVISDKDQRKRVKRILGNVNVENIKEYGETCNDETVKSMPMDTFSSKTYSFRYMKTPDFASKDFNIAQFTPLDRPLMKINSSGKVIDDQNVFQEGSLPLFGSKNCEYIVFYDNTLDASIIKDYFRQLTSAYSFLGFGKLLPFSQGKYMVGCFREKEVSCANKFFEENKLLFNRENHIICYVVSTEFPDTSFYESSKKFGLKWLLFDDIDEANDEDYKEEAYELYSLLRTCEISPFGEVFQPTFKLPNFFFGFRYHHPYNVSRIGNKITIFIFYDPISSFSVWTDDAGSSLAFKESTTISLIKECIQEQTNFFQPTNTCVNFNLTIVSEYVDDKLLNNLKNELGMSIPIISIFPAPYVQVEIQYESSNDVFIEEPFQISRFKQKSFRSYMQIPIAYPFKSGFVVSQNLQAYQVGFYTPSIDTTLYLNQMSALSWMTAKPNFYERYTSLPPPVAIIISRSDQPTSVYSRFPFSAEYEKHI